MPKARPKHAGGRPRTLELSQFGRTLEAAAAARGLTRQELAERAGLPPGTVWRWMIGRHAPSLEGLRELARASGADLDDLVHAALAR
jgi:transcriptional regulator with XRE-family HTH domain